MKTPFSINALIALAVAVAGAVNFQSRAAETSVTVTANANARVLPPEIQNNTPAAEVLKLVQAGVDVSVIQAYISNCPSAFNMDADKIISLSDAGLPGDLVNAMIAHDKTYLASLATAGPTPAPAPAQAEQPAEPSPVAESAPQLPEPPAEITVNYFYDNLTPYGSWVEVDGYGRCWRPNVVRYDANWRPYCDRGHWVYTDCGWYWNSDYSWGITFHYGRWFNTPRYGWCWWPDTVWSSSWVTWRSYNDYCGWAPLPPYTVYQPGIGFYYYGKSVSVGFSFGLAANCYTFVSAGHFCDTRPRNYCVPAYQVNQFYNQTVVINNFNYNNNKYVNNGVSVTTINQATHHPIQPVPASTLAGQGRHELRNVPGGHRYNEETAGNQNNRPTAVPDSHQGQGRIAGNDNHQSANTTTQTSPAPATTRDNHQPIIVTRGPTPTSRPAPSTSVPVSRPAAPATPPQSQARNNLLGSGSFNRQPVQPSTPQNSPGVTQSRPVNPSSWNDSGNARVISRPTHSQPVNDAPPVTVQQPRYNNNSSQPATSQPVLRGNITALPTPSMAQGQNQPQNGNSGSHGWFAREH